jgi:tetratricopeptide (TPR) repeat protein
VNERRECSGLNNQDNKGGTDISHVGGDVIGVGVQGSNNIIAKNIQIGKLIEETRSLGLELLDPLYFEQHKKVGDNVKSWYRGFSLSLESIYYDKEFKRDEILNGIISKLNDQRCLLLLGESGSSKTTLLNEVICHYFNQNYTIFYSYGDKEVSDPEKIRDTVEDTVTKGNKVLISVDNVHDKKTSGIFYVIELLKSFNKSEDVKFILTARLPDYDWFIKYGIDTVPNKSYKDAVKQFADDPTLKYPLKYFTVEEIQKFILKYVIPVPSSEQQLELAQKIHSSTNGNPILVKFAVLGEGLRKDVEDRIEDYLKKDSNFMLTALVSSILTIGGIKITNELLGAMGIKKYAVRLEHATLYNSGNGVWTTIHSRWDIELLRILFVEQNDEIILDTNKDILRNAVRCMFAIKDENLIVSAIQTLYNTIAINNLIPLDIVDETVRANIPSTLSHETLSTIYGVIMPPAFLMLGKYDVIEVLCEQARLANSADPDICYNLALTLTAIGKYDKAIEWCDRAIGFKENYGDVLYMRSCLNIKLGNIERALEDLQKAIEINKEIYAELAKRETYFDTVRGDKRFIAIVQANDNLVNPIS